MGLNIKLTDQDEGRKTAATGSTPAIRLATTEQILSNSNPRTIQNPGRSGRYKQILRKSAFFLFLFLILGGIAAGGYLAYKANKTARDIGINLNPGDIIDSVTTKDPELRKDSAGKKTNFLLVGIDTRESNGNLQNTDSIIVASYDYDKNEAIMISIPRDFHVEILDRNWYARINSVYFNAETEAKGTGLDELKKTAEAVTGLEIQYYAMVDMKAFTEIVDTIGGIDVYVENSFTDYQYPTGITTGPISKQVETVSFTKGLQTMDGETALKYARSRHGNGVEGTDFARAKRQQNVIKAVKSKALSSGTLLDLSTLVELMDVLGDNIKISEINTNDMKAGLALLKKSEDTKIYSFVLDPSSANGKIIKTGVIPGPAYSNGPVKGLGKYEDIHSYIEAVMENPMIYESKAKVYVYNTGLGNSAVSAKVKELQKKYPYLNIIYQGTLYSNKEGTLVYDNSTESKFSPVVNFFAAEFETELKSQPDYITTKLNGEDVVILVGLEPTPIAPEVTTGEAE